METIIQKVLDELKLILAPSDGVSDELLMDVAEGVSYGLKHVEPFEKCVSPYAVALSVIERLAWELSRDTKLPGDVRRALSAIRLAAVELSKEDVKYDLSVDATLIDRVGTSGKKKLHAA